MAGIFGGIFAKKYQKIMLAKVHQNWPNHLSKICKNNRVKNSPKYQPKIYKKDLLINLSKIPLVTWVKLTTNLHTIRKLFHIFFVDFNCRKSVR